MSGCRLCGCPTSRRLCRQCEIEDRAEERARARKRLEEDDEESDDDPTPATDGGYETTQTATATRRAEAERRARQAARTLDHWSRVARLDLVAIVQEETPVRFGNSRSLPPLSVDDSPEPIFRLVCRDCPFEGHSVGEDAQTRLDRAQTVHQTVFDHETTVEQVDASSGTTASTGGVDR